ncbi:MAG: hypothetical protein LWX07_11045 [Bacteroidetes bacterium]|nr:hypothetical protein [Bacteroidota bacterium]
MKRLYLIAALLLAVACSAQAQVKPAFGISFGTTFGSYTGADFGSTYAFSFPYSRYNDSYYYNNYYYHPQYDRYDFYAPLIFDIGFDYNVTDHAALNLESSFIWHYGGRPSRNYVTGETGGISYIDKWDNAQLFAVPLFLNVKIYPFGRSRSSFFISGGYGMQYTSESMDRIREEYDYNYNYNDYGYLVGSASSKKWLNGVKASIGFQYPLSPFTTAEAEFKVTNFFPKRNPDSPLAMNTSTNITFVGLSTKIYFNF